MDQCISWHCSAGPMPFVLPAEGVEQKEKVQTRVSEHVFFACEHFMLSFCRFTTLVFAIISFSCVSFTCTSQALSVALSEFAL